MTDRDWLTAEEVAESLDLCLPVACEMIRRRQVGGVLRNVRPMRVSREGFAQWLRTGVL
jgi:hypothetical protein